MAARKPARSKLPPTAGKSKGGRPALITDDVVSYAANMLVRRAHKHEVFALLKHKHGLSTRSCETVVARARELIAAQAGKTRREHRDDAYGFYVSVMRDTAATLGEKMYAQTRICQLLGLDAPQQHRHEGHDGGAIRSVQVVEVVVATRQDVATMQRLMDRQEKVIDAGPAAGEGI